MNSLSVAPCEPRCRGDDVIISSSTRNNELLIMCMYLIYCHLPLTFVFCKKSGSHLKVHAKIATTVYSAMIIIFLALSLMSLTSRK